MNSTDLIRRGPLSAEHRAKISAAQKGKKRGPMNISPQRESERREKIAASLLGRKLSVEHRAKLAAWHKSKKLSAEHRANIGRAIRGREVSQETRRKMSEASKGQKPTALCIERGRTANTGRKWSDETRRLRSASSMKAEKSPAWKGGITPENERIRASLEMKLWREAVFNRDNFTCQECAERGGDLNAHHVKPFCSHPKLRFDVANGLTLCEPCHRDIHRGWRADKEAA